MLTIDVVDQRGIFAERAHQCRQLVVVGTGVDRVPPREIHLLEDAQSQRSHEIRLMVAAALPCGIFASSAASASRRVMY
jgi:hypothetical protein